MDKGTFGNEGVNLSLGSLQLFPALLLIPHVTPGEPLNLSSTVRTAGLTAAHLTEDARMDLLQMGPKSIECALPQLLPSCSR